MNDQQAEAQPPQLVHRAPLPGTGTTPCCGRVPFELPLDDGVTVLDANVTCSALPPASQETDTGTLVAAPVGSVLVDPFDTRGDAPVVACKAADGRWQPVGSGRLWTSAVEAALTPDQPIGGGE